jgi:DNA polymerase III alpha subunit
VFYAFGFLPRFAGAAESSFFEAAGVLFEDETALYETVIFPAIYDTYYPLLFDQRPLLVYGRVVKEWEAVSLEVAKVEGL